MENMPTVRTELIGKGVNFTQAFVSNSLCCPSRASTLTGQYSHTNGVWRNVPPNGGYKTFLPHETDTVATRLHAAGYTTGLVGKYMNGYYAKLTRNPSGLANRPGWDTWVAFLGRNASSETPAYYNYTLDVNGVSQVYGTAEAEYSTDVLGAKAPVGSAGARAGPRSPLELCHPFNSGVDITTYFLTLLMKSANSWCRRSASIGTIRRTCGGPATLRPVHR